MSKSYHMCMNVRGFIRNTKFPRGYAGIFRHEDGRSMTPDEAREQLFNELAQGHEVIPCVSKGACDNFDYSGGGCQGHEEQP